MKTVFILKRSAIKPSGCLSSIIFQMKIHFFFLDYIYCWFDGEIATKNLRISGVSAKIRSGHLPNICLQRYSTNTLCIACARSDG